MYLSKFQIENIKCIERATFEFPYTARGSYAGWNVLLGANATGKSTLLRAIAVSLMGPSAWKAFDPSRWVRQGAKEGLIFAKITKGIGDVPARNSKGPFAARVRVVESDPDEELDDGYAPPCFVLNRSDGKSVRDNVYDPKKQGWFSAGYGPFRRLSGGSVEVLSTLKQPRQQRVASLFHESVAMSDCEAWLKELHHAANDPDRKHRIAASATFDAVREVINELLPGAVSIESISSGGVLFRSGATKGLRFNDLSDGYRSFLALVVDILKHLTDANEGAIPTVIDPKKLTASSIDAEGVVLIDEVCAHLHPTWQRSIGPRLMRVFPKMQFIVSTHSPLVAQSATEGGLFVLSSSDGERVVATQPVKSVRGWRTDAILTSDLFGLADTLDEKTSEDLRRYHQLSSRHSFGAALSSDEKRDLDRLTLHLGEVLRAPGETKDQFEQRLEGEAMIRRAIEAEKSKASA
jgi:hypothetical protein